jgi:hypothetical protein
MLGGAATDAAKRSTSECNGNTEPSEPAPLNAIPAASGASCHTMVPNAISPMLPSAAPVASSAAASRAGRSSLSILCCTDSIRHPSAARSHRLAAANRCISHRLVLHFGIQLCADQDDCGREPKPKHEDDDCGQRSIGLVVAAEVGRVPGEPNRNRDPGY